MAYSDRIAEVFAGTYVPDLTEFDGHVGLLACGCLSVSCGGVVARVQHTTTHVIWEDFQHANDPDVDYPTLGPYRFAREQYDHEVTSLIARATALPPVVCLPLTSVLHAQVTAGWVDAGDA